MRRLLAVACAALASLVGPVHADDAAVAYIEIQDIGTGQILNEGSGFLIDLNGHLLTAAHLFRDTGREMNEIRALVHFGGREGRQRRAQVVDCGEDNIDACLIKVWSSAAKTDGVQEAFRPVCRALTSEEQVVAKGYPPGEANPLNTVPGIISGDLGEFLKYQTTLPLQPGMSGGPVFDAERIVVAMNTGQAEGFPGFTFVQPLGYLIDMIEKAGIQCWPAVSTPTEEFCPDLSISIPGDDIAAFIENRDNEGRPFRWVDAMSDCDIGEMRSTSIGPGARARLNSEPSDDGLEIFVAPESFDLVGSIAPMVVSVQQWPIDP